jgi:2'-5' RNA ligase
LATACVQRLAAAVAGSVATSTESVPFWPHITLARLGRPTDVRRFAHLESEHVFAFHRITLYDSFISPNGPPRYQALMTVPLGSHRERTHHNGKVAGA